MYNTQIGIPIYTHASPYTHAKRVNIFLYINIFLCDKSTIFNIERALCRHDVEGPYILL